MHTTFPKEFLARLRQQANVADIVGQTVRLTRKGQEFSGLCPFHNEKSPSFTVNPRKGFYHCFGCGAHGDALTFLQEKNGLSFAEAVKHLAQQTGMTVPVASPQAQQQWSREQALREACQAAAQWFRQQLSATTGLPARRYLAGRGVNSDVIEIFQLGYAPPGNGCTAALQQQGIDAQLLVDAGISGRDEQTGRLYDRFRGRLMFPIADASGVIAFGGRTMDGSEPKYLNSPETPLFHKGSVLYQVPQRSFSPGGTVLLVEGYMDVIALHQHGFPGAQAPLGTAVTEQQLQRLWKKADTIVFCLDGDSAGQRAADRAVERALPLLQTGKQLSFLLLPQGDDPDSLLQREGREGLERLLKTPLGLREYLLRIALRAHNRQTPDGKAAILSTLQRAADSIGDKTLAGFYRRDLQNLFYNSLRKQPGAAALTAATTTGSNGMHEEALLAVCLHHITEGDSFVEALGSVTFRTAANEQLRCALVDLWSDSPPGESDACLQWLQQRGLASVMTTVQKGRLLTAGCHDFSQVLTTWCEALHFYQRRMNKAPADANNTFDIFSESGKKQHLLRLREHAALIAMEN